MFYIGDNIIDSDGFCCRITDVRDTSIEVFHTKKTKNGINCKQWYQIDRELQKRFKFGLSGYLSFINNESCDKINTYFKTKDLIDKFIW